MTIDIANRAVGILVIEEGVIIRAHPTTEDRTDITVAPNDVIAGAIIRDPATGRWRYDETARRALGINGDPDFATDIEAGRELQEHLPPLPQVREFFGRGRPVPPRPKDDGGEVQT